MTNINHPTWNVLVPVVELIAAPDAGNAIRILSSRLAAAGFDVYDGEGASAFLSEEDTHD